MPRPHPPATDKERSPLRLPQPSLASAVPGLSASSPPLRIIQSFYPEPGQAAVAHQPTYSQTILQAPTLATNPSILPPITYREGPSSATSRRQSSSSMRNASMTFDDVAPGSTPTGRISKAKKGRRVHACEFPGCGKVFTRAEHRRRHELNHNPEAVFRCPQQGCGKAFHRIDLLQRHEERHQEEASSLLQSSRPQHSNFYTPPPSVLPSTPITSAPSESTPRTGPGGLSIGNLVHPPHSQFNDTSVDFSPFVSTYPQNLEPSYHIYNSDGSISPASDHISRYHRQSVSPESSVAHFDPSSISPTMTTSVPGMWMPATAAPPLVLPTNPFEESQATYVPLPTVSSMPVHLRELDGHEFTEIQRELSTLPGLIFDTATELPRYIRSDCLEHYWKYFHPSFPIVYKPNFVTNTPPPLLLSAVLAIGSFYDSRPDAKQYSLALHEIATRLLRQRENVTSRSRIADLQTVLLLEIFSKYCARYSMPETSARFRALFASLHQAQQTLAQCPLSVYRTLKEARSDDDLKRAHKFWLEHEARRRIFHACSVLDAQQVALFGQRPTVITHSNVQSRTSNTHTGVDLPCDESLWEASPLSVWYTRAALTLSQDVDTARAMYQTASVSHCSFFQHQIINVNGSVSQRCSEEISSPPQRADVLSKTRYNFHVFQMAQHVPVRQLLIAVGESCFLGHKIEQKHEYIAAKEIVRRWVTDATSNVKSGWTSRSQQAHWHALKVLRIVVNLHNPAQPFRSTNMLHEDWSIYLATLVCWAHGYGCENPSLASPMSQASASLEVSRKRKRAEIQTPQRKRQPTVQTTSKARLAPSSAIHTTQVPIAIPVSSYTDHSWSAYDPVNRYAAQWPGDAHYDAQMLASSTRADANTTTENSAYAPSTTATVLTRTGTNTPQSQVSLATTSVTTSAPTMDEPLAEMKMYLSLTDVPSAEALADLDSAVVRRTKGLLEAVRIYKIGSKGAVGGLMNDAESVLLRLAEGRNKDIF